MDHYKFVLDQNVEPNQDKLWIVKPCNQACGRGIKIINKSSKLKNDSGLVVSE